MACSTYNKIDLNKVNLCGKNIKDFEHHFGEMVYMGQEFSPLGGYTGTGPKSEVNYISFEFERVDKFMGKFNNKSFLFKGLYILPNVTKIYEGSIEKTKDCIGELLIVTTNVIICIPIIEKKHAFSSTTNTSIFKKDLKEKDKINIDDLIPKNNLFYYFNGCEKLFNQNMDFIVFDKFIELDRDTIERMKLNELYKFKDNSTTTVDACRSNNVARRREEIEKDMSKILGDDFEVQCDPYYLYDENNDNEIWIRRNKSEVSIDKNKKVGVKKEDPSLEYMFIIIAVVVVIILLVFVIKLFEWYRSGVSGMEAVTAGR